MASAAETHTKIRLPLEEAVKADFPPGCKVLCFDDNGFRVGVVKSVMVSISLPSKNTFGTFYDVEMKGSTVRDARISGIFSSSDLRLTPDSPVEVDAEYFGSVFKFAGGPGSSGKVRGTVLGSFEIPPSRCNRCVQRVGEIPTARKFLYSVRVKFHGMEEAIEAHGVPPEHVAVISSMGLNSDASTILSEGLDSIVIGGGVFHNHEDFDDFKENTNAHGHGRASVVPRRKPQRITPEDVPMNEQTSFKSTAMDGCFQESFNESFNVMYHHENSTKSFGAIIANGDREIYDSEAASSYEERVLAHAPVPSSPRRSRDSDVRGRSQSRPRSQSVHRSRSQSRTRIYEKTQSARTVHSNLLPTPPRRQLKVSISSSEEDSIIGYDEEDIEYEEAEIAPVEKKHMRNTRSPRRKGNRTVEESEDREDRTVTPRPKSSERRNQNIAEYLDDQETEEEQQQESEESPSDADETVESPPKDEEAPQKEIHAPATPATPSGNARTYGSTWSPSVRSSGEKVETPTRQTSQTKVHLAPPSPKAQAVVAPVSSRVHVQPNASVEGCYLLYDPGSSGKLILQYSKTLVNGAIGFWAPGGEKKLQGFKFTQNQGRSDLLTGIAGADYKKKYYNGWCQFVKAAKIHKGYLCKWSEHERIEIDIYVFYSDSCEVKMIGDGELFDASGIDAVACLPRGKSTFKGVKTGEYGSFLGKGGAAGASMSMQ